MQHDSNCKDTFETGINQEDFWSQKAISLYSETDPQPFIVKISDEPDEIQEEIIELQHDSNCKDTFETGIKQEDFWSQKAISFPKIREVALRYLILFSIAYLCEQGFSDLLIIKNKHRNRLDASADMRLALSSTKPRMVQSQKSH